jgi:hypothetical protein
LTHELISVGAVHESWKMRPEAGAPATMRKHSVNACAESLAPVGIE